MRCAPDRHADSVSTQPPPNAAIDGPFLYDLYSFEWYNHHVGAVALYDAVASIDRFYGPTVHENYRLEVEPPRAQFDEEQDIDRA